MAAPTIGEMLKYANLQIATEALYDFRAKERPNQVPGDITSLTGHFSGVINPAWLTLGNEHASRFTPTEAEKFVQEWEVVDHLSNTSTGFSGTLFKNKNTSELVLSIRSTEFLDDLVRDCVATNGLEIKTFGWAFGQIADMEAWYDQLKASGKLPAGARFDVTGYSLGAHLATAFNLLHQSELNGGQVITFNGAGVGQLRGDATLAGVIDRFNQLRNSPSDIAALITDDRLRAVYLTLSARIKDGEPVMPGDFALLDSLIPDAFGSEALQQQFQDEKALIRSALDRIQNIQSQVARIELRQVTDSQDGAPAAIPHAHIEQENFDYQMAVLIVQEDTLSKSAATGVYNAYFDNKSLGTPFLGNQFDIVGRETTTHATAMVANSQWHHGTNIDVFIEDQPLLRGIFTIFDIQTYWDTGALVPINEYSRNDFGDTHSIVLIVDSLNVQNLLKTLVPEATQGEIETLFKAASATQADSATGTQGKAEGDVLENVLDGLSRVFLASDPLTRSDKAKNSDDLLTGNTWADADHRERFYNSLDAVAGIIASAGLAGKLTLSLPDTALATAARTDFAAFLTLLTGSPVALKSVAGQEDAVAAALSGAWSDVEGINVYADWQADQALTLAQRTPEKLHYTDQYLADRTAYLTWMRTGNLANLPEIAGKTVIDGRQYGYQGVRNWEFTNLDVQPSLTRTYFVQGSIIGGTSKVLFGTLGAETGPAALTGALGDDHLYGLLGNDSLDGGKGADWLEGNQGNDSLTGGEGADTLLGGVGDDLLEGGKGHDSLSGGLGDDTYLISSGDGWDWIEDKDGAGHLEMDSVRLGQGLTYKAPNVWQQKDAASGKTFTYSLYAGSESGETFQILAIQGSTGGVWIKRWQDGQLGITLPGAPDPQVRPALDSSGSQLATAWYEPQHTVTDNLSQGIGETRAQGDHGEALGHGSLVGNDFDNRLESGGGNDILKGQGGRDTLLGKGGDDTLEGADADDALSGGDGNDLLQGGLADDVLAGGLGADILEGGDGADYLLGGSSYTASRADWNVTRRAPGSPILDFNQFSGSWYLDDDANDILRGGKGDDHLWGGSGADQLYGDEDNDELVGHDGDDELHGGSGNDTLVGDGAEAENPNWYILPQYHGDDILDGDAGDDWLAGDGGADLIRGGDGNDEIHGDIAGLAIEFQGNDTLEGGQGADQIWGDGGDDLISGGSEDDYLRGDSINAPFAQHGRDTLDGGEGNDTVAGDGGDDVVMGGAGNDTLQGDIEGIPEASQGNDLVLGGTGNDLIDGAGGDDTLRGEDDDDLLWGQAGNDVLDGGDGKDGLLGGEGADSLTGGGGTDLLKGEAGDDTYFFNLGDSPLSDLGQYEGIVDEDGSNVVRFGAGIDIASVQTQLDTEGGFLIIDYSGGDHLAIQNGYSGAIGRFEFADGATLTAGELLGRTADFGASGTALDGTFFVYGGKQSDTLASGTSRAQFHGGRGDDTLEGSGGNHTYTYERGDGNDTLRDTSAKTDASGQPAPNTLQFAAGITADELVLGREPGVLKIALAGGQGEVLRIEGFDPEDALGLHPIDRYAFADGTTLTHAQLLARGFELVGGAGDDSLTGTSVDDRIDGGAGNDSLRGGLGNDSYFWGSGSGNDRVDNTDAGSGFDTLRIRGLTPADLVLIRQLNDLVVRCPATGETVTAINHYAGAALDAIVFDDATTWTTAEIDLHLTRELTEGADNFTGTAGNDLIAALGGNDTIYGLSGADTIDGGNGLDLIYGGDGNDSLLGGAGNDTLRGEGQDDLLVGGVGDDVLEGGGGNDLLDAGDGNDVLYGGSGDDRLDGGFGDDTLIGEAGNDTYLFGLGSRNDTIMEAMSDPAGVDTLLIGTNLKSSDVRVETFEGEHLYITIKTSGERLILNNYLHDPGSAYKIERFVFSDGEVWDVPRVEALLTGGSEAGDRLSGHAYADILDGLGGNDTIYGYGGDDRLFGSAGNDSLQGGMGNDYLDGGVGADTLFGYDGNDNLEGGDGDDSLYGGESWQIGGDDTLHGSAGYDKLLGYAGNDTYVLKRGDGYDKAFELSGTDRVLLGAGIVATDVSLFREGDNLIVALDSGATQLLCANHFAAPDYQIEKIQFDGGTVWTATDIAARTIVGTPNAMTGTAGNDVFQVDDRRDTISEAVGQGIDTVRSWVTYTLPANVENLQATGYLHIDLFGNSLNNQLTGNSGDNLLYGDVGDDTLIGGGGNDVLSDRYGRNTFYGGQGDDVYRVSADVPPDGVESLPTLIEYAGEGIDTLYASAAVVSVLPQNIENFVGLNRWLFYKCTLTGNALDNAISARIGDNIDGGLGADVMTFTADLGNNPGYYPGLGEIAGSTAYVDNLGDRVVGGGLSTRIITSINLTLAEGLGILELADGSGATRATGNSANNFINGNEFANVLRGLDGNDTLYGELGADTLVGGRGDDSYYVDIRSFNLPDQDYSPYFPLPPLEDLVVEAQNEGIDTVISIYDYTLGDNVENLILEPYDYLDGWRSTRYPVAGTGNALANRITGNAGGNLLDGGAGADTLVGGAGHDTYRVDDIRDVVIENAGWQEGTDTVIATTSYSLGANIEKLVLMGVADLSGWGNAASETFDGSSCSGHDRFYGGGGDDIYVLGAGDVAIETAGGGSDTVLVDSDFTVVEFLENATAAGSQATTLTGSAENNRLDGSTSVAANTLVGLGGDDVYVVGSGDVVVEAESGGNDTVLAEISAVLSAQVENLTLTGAANLAGTGNGLANVLTGNAGDNLLDGGGGADTLRGGDGNDTYRVDEGVDVVDELGTAGSASDLVMSSISYTLGQNVENLVLLGGVAISGTGNELANRLDGQQNAAANTLSGAAGDDVYVVGAGDVVVENAGAGVDTVETALTWTLATNLENLTLVGSVAVAGYGNGSNNVLRGNLADNVLDGGAGADTLVGGRGNDTYWIDNAGDQISETTGEGNDSAFSSVNILALASNVENLTLTGAAASAVGNALANVITGNALANSLSGGDGDDLLDGGTGNDTLIGGKGNDTLVVDSALDVVTENAGEGTDTVRAGVTVSLATLVNVENLVLTGGTALDGTGNALANVLTGNSAANLLDGGGGADTLIGGLGDDTYRVDNAGDQIRENAGEGTDAVQATVTHTLAANLENLTLTGSLSINGTGNGLANRLTGNASNNTLDGGLGADTLDGGLGTDIYVVDNAGDVIIEAAGAGTDTVQSSISFSLATLTNVENITLTGGANINATGNDLANALVGNSGVNTLAGGLGGDVYTVDSLLDVVVEAAGAGTDTIQTGITYSLAAIANVENLTLSGGANVNGTGNDLANTLTGNTGTNTLAGGLGNDLYNVDSLADVVVEAAGAGTDTIQTGITYSLAAIANVENLTLSGGANVNGTGNSLANVLTGNTGTNVLSGGAGDDTYIVQNTTDTVIEAAGSGTDTVQSSVTFSLAANVENLTLTGSLLIDGTGNELANVLNGNGVNNRLTGGLGNDTLDGKAGSDTLTGGAGDDTYVVDAATDVVVEVAGEGTDTVNSAVTLSLAGNVENLTLTGFSAINGTGNAADNTLTGNNAANVLTGGLGNDVLDGKGGADALVGGAGDDTYLVDIATDTVTEVAGEGYDIVSSVVTLTLAANAEALFLTGAYSINGTGNTLDNLLRGNDAANTLNGSLGNDLLEGGIGNDVLTDNAGAALFNGGTGNDSLTGGTAAEVYLGGMGNDLLTTGAGNDVVLFNKGDGQDSFATGGSGSDTVSLGGGIAYTDLFFAKSGSDLVLKLGGTDQITFKDWYAATPVRPVANLQIIAEAMAGFAPGGGNPLLDQKVERFNFAGLAAAFDTARAADATLTNWGLSNALATQAVGGSDTAALGGDLAYQYGKSGTLAGIGVTPALAVIADVNLGTVAQTLNPLATLQTGSVRLT